jgi:fermentation-respiration switch protein FrsA (DUF1100 family)
MTRIALGLAATVLTCAAILLLAWAGQRRLIYLPMGGPVPPPRDVGLDTGSQVRLATDDGLVLQAWFVEAAATPAGWTLILFNGNAGHRAVRAPLARRLAQLGVAVLMVDYRGYGGNPGSPTEDGLLKDARAARRWLARRAAPAPPTRVCYFGESLGTGVAVALAAEDQPDAVILRSPYTSLADVGSDHFPFLPVRWLLRDRYPSIDRIGRLDCPVLIIAAERDTVVPATLSRELFEAARPSRRRFLLLPGLDHNDYEALAGDAVIEGIIQFLQDAGRPTGS